MSSSNITIKTKTTTTTTTSSQPLFIERNKSKQKGDTSSITLATSFKSLLTPNNNLSSDSTEGYYKLSYNQSVNEILGTSFKPDKRNSVNDANAKSFRSQSFTLLSLNNDG
jgi:hypothetical protein